MRRKKDKEVQFKDLQKKYDAALEESFKAMENIEKYREWIEIEREKFRKAIFQAKLLDEEISILLENEIAYES